MPMMVRKRTHRETDDEPRKRLSGQSRNTRTRRLALAMVRQLRRAGWSWREIGRRFDDPESMGALEQTPPGPRFPPESSNRAIPSGQAPPATPDHRRFLRALDAVPVGLAFFDHAGLLLHANHRLAALLDPASERERLQQEVLHFAYSLTDMLRVRTALHTTSEGGVEEIAEREVRTSEGHYRLRGSRIGIDLFGLGSSLLVALEHVASGPLSNEMLRERFGLTDRECRIAHLLAEGRSNAGIVAALGISPHTARHHTERVLLKLGVRSRAEVGRKLHNG